MGKVKITMTNTSPFHKNGDVVELEESMATHWIKKGFAIEGEQPIVEEPEPMEPEQVVAEKPKKKK